MAYKRPSRANYMTLEERAQRRFNIIQMHRDGHVPTNIAKRYGITSNYVRVILAEAGEVVPEPRQNDINPMWEMDDDARRRAITNKAARAAREALKKNFSTLSTQPTRVA